MLISMLDPPSKSNNFHCEHVRLLLSSYAKFVGTDLVGKESDGVSDEELASELFGAGYVVLSHDTADDPIFNYANQAAMDLFEMDWSAITKLPSRKSAEPMNRADRERLLTAVKKDNFIDDYSGVRISSTGLRFFIPKAIVWNLVDDRGSFCGQAATFSEWQVL